MVKVKEATKAAVKHEVQSFNHPMVKVKAARTLKGSTELIQFQPPYGES